MHLNFLEALSDLVLKGASAKTFDKYNVHTHLKLKSYARDPGG